MEIRLIIRTVLHSGYADLGGLQPCAEQLSISASVPSIRPRPIKSASCARSLVACQAWAPLRNPMGDLVAVDGVGAAVAGHAAKQRFHFRGGRLRSGGLAAATSHGEHEHAAIG